MPTVNVLTALLVANQLSGAVPLTEAVVVIAADPIAGEAEAMAQQYMDEILPLNTCTVVSMN